jgi:hypothetical protein
MRPLLLLVVALVILPHPAKSEKAVKGQGPVLVKVLPDYPYAARDQHLEGSGLYRLNIKPEDRFIGYRSQKHRLHSLGPGSYSRVPAVALQIRCSEDGKDPDQLYHERSHILKAAVRSNQPLQPTATRCAFTFSMIKSVLEIASRAAGSRG